MKSAISSENFSYKREFDFYLECLKKSQDKFVNIDFDMNCFLLLCIVSVMGLNKENIEENDNLKDYGYTIVYPCENGMDSYKIIMKQVMEARRKHSNIISGFGDGEFIKFEAEYFDNSRKQTTKYD